MQRWMLEIVCRLLQWRGLSAALVALWLMGGSGATAQTLTIGNTPYFTDFESGTPTGWWNTRFNSQATLTRFLGNYGKVGSTQEATYLILNGTPNTRYTLVFDLYLIDTWDAGHATWGPDSFSVTDLFTGTIFNAVPYSAHSPSTAATYPAMWDQSGNFYGTSSSETIYRSIVVRFESISSLIVLMFQGGANEALANESWAIDNVRVIETKDEGDYIPRFINTGKFRTFEVTTTQSADWGASPTWADLSRNGGFDALLTGSSTRQMKYNRSTGKFTATTLAANFARQARVFDLDADGDLDIFGFQDVNGERFLLSNGAGSFTSVGDLGLSVATNNRGLCIVDANGDGYPDPIIFSSMTNWLGTSSGLDPLVPAPLMSATTTAIAMTPSAEAWMNSAGAAGAGGSVASGDVNDDGVVDFMYQLGYGALFLSQSGGGWALAETTIRLPYTSERLGMQWADIDNDGDLDLVVANPIGPMQAWINEGGVFVERASSLGLVAGVNTRSVCIGDYTNDGYLDVYAVAMGTGGNVMFRGKADGTFAAFNDRAANAGATNLDAAMGDYDNDGDLDLAVTAQNSVARLFDNITNNTSYLKVRFLGMGPEASNASLRCGNGVTIRLYDATGTQYLGRRELGAARGLASSEPLIAHFGGVNPASTYVVKVRARGRDHSIEVRPSSATSVVHGATMAQTLTINEEDLKPALRVVRWREVAAAE